MYNGKSVLSSTILETFLQTSDEALSPTKKYNLTRRELEIIRYIANGKNNAEIANTLKVSLSTIKHHVSSILNKLNVTSRAEAVSMAIKQKLVN